MRKLILCVSLTLAGYAMAGGAPNQKPNLYDLAYQHGFESEVERKRAAEQMAVEDSRWWGKNKAKAVAKRRDYNECVLKHIGSANASAAVAQVRYSCQQLHWPHEWPGKYLTQSVPN